MEIGIKRQLAGHQMRDEVLRALGEANVKQLTALVTGHRQGKEKKLRNNL